MKFEEKIDHPLVFRLSHLGCTILGSSDHKEDLPLSVGAMIGGEHYGFILIVDKYDAQSEFTYLTQCRVSAVELKDDELVVYEEHKYVPWKFDINGNFIEAATFLNISRRDIDYLSSQGIVGEEGIEEVNSYAFAYKKH